jgi:hypothetical protein
MLIRCLDRYFAHVSTCPRLTALLSRPFRGVPGKPDFKLFFSPDVAMANELCSSKDALPSEFKYVTVVSLLSPSMLHTRASQVAWLTCRVMSHGQVLSLVSDLAAGPSRSRVQQAGA